MLKVIRCAGPVQLLAQVVHTPDRRKKQKTPLHTLALSGDARATLPDGIGCCTPPQVLSDQRIAANEQTCTRSFPQKKKKGDAPVQFDSGAVQVYGEAVNRTHRGFRAAPPCVRMPERLP